MRSLYPSGHAKESVTIHQCYNQLHQYMKMRAGSGWEVAAVGVKVE